MGHGKRLSKEFANKVFDILVKEGGAYEGNRDNFIYVHTEDEYPCWEYRFQGHFGFGGKYWSERNNVTYYMEDSSPELDELEIKINKLLGELSE